MFKKKKKKRLEKCYPNHQITHKISAAFHVTDWLVSIIDSERRQSKLDWTSDTYQPCLKTKVTYDLPRAQLRKSGS